MADLHSRHGASLSLGTPAINVHNTTEDLGSSEANTSSEPPPDGGYGWICVLACFLVNGFTWGITASYGVYLSHYLDSNVFPGATPIDFAFIGGFNFSAAMVASPLVTFLTRKYGKHTSMAMGIFFQATGFATASVSRRIWQLYISQGVLVGLGTGFLYIPSTAILSQWFAQKRSLANGISAAGSGVGGAIFAWTTGYMITRLSVAWALRITCLVGVIGNTVATTLLRDRNKHVRPPQLAFDTRLLLRLHVGLLLSWAFVSMLGYITLLYSLGDFAIAIGLSRSESTTIISVLNIGTAVGRPIIGIWSDKYRRVDVAAILTTLCGISCFIFWLPAQGYGLTIFFSLLIGAILGVFWMGRWPISSAQVRSLIMRTDHWPTLRRDCRPQGAPVTIINFLAHSSSANNLSVRHHDSIDVSLTTMLVSEVIALQLRRNNKTLPYLYTQIFAGTAYLIAGVIMGVLAMLKRRDEKRALVQCQSR